MFQAIQTLVLLGLIDKSIDHLLTQEQNAH